MIEARTGRDGARLYRARVYYRGRYVASRTFTRKRDAEAWERRQVDGLRSGVWSDPGAADRPIRDWCDAWLAAQPPGRRRPNARSAKRSASGSRKRSGGARRYPFDRLRSGPGPRIWHEHSPLQLRVTRWASYVVSSTTRCRTGPSLGIPRQVYNDNPVVGADRGYARVAEYFACRSCQVLTDVKDSSARRVDDRGSAGW